MKKVLFSYYFFVCKKFIGSQSKNQLPLSTSGGTTTIEKGDSESTTKVVLKLKLQMTKITKAEPARKQNRSMSKKKRERD